MTVDGILTRAFNIKVCIDSQSNDEYTIVI